MTPNSYTYLDLWGPGINFDERFTDDYEELEKKLLLARQAKLLIVLTQGGYDIRHAGHDDFLEIAKIEGSRLAMENGLRGCILLVAVDTDEGIRLRKGNNNPGVPRPAIPQMERAKSVASPKPVDLVTFDHYYYPEGHPRQGHSTFEFVAQIKPDLYVASETSYEAHQLEELERHAAKVICIPMQGVTTSSAIIRNIVLGNQQANDEAIRCIHEQGCIVLDAAIAQLVALREQYSGGKVRDSDSTP